MTFRSPFKAIDDITDDPALLRACQQAGSQADVATVHAGILEAWVIVNAHLADLDAEIAAKQENNTHD